MVQINLTSDQTELLKSATDVVYITSAEGHVVAKVNYPELSEEEAALVAKSRKRLASGQPTRLFSEIVQEFKGKYSE